MDEEELYRLMNEEDDFYMGNQEEIGEQKALSEKVNNTGCLGILIVRCFSWIP
jgi:hypothetical protein